ncbi:MAG: hypothetical protein Q9223_002752 [Gallowayella weberi]
MDSASTTMGERSDRIDLSSSVARGPSTAIHPQGSETREPARSHSNGQYIRTPSAGEHWRCSTQPSGSLEYRHGLESARRLSEVDEDVVKDVTNDKEEVIQFDQEEKNKAITQHKLVTKEEDAQGEGDEFDAALTLAKWGDKPLQKTPINRPLSLDQVLKTPQKRGRGRPPGSKNKPKSTLSHPRQDIVPHAKHTIRKLSETPFRSTSDRQVKSWAGLQTSHEMTPRLDKRCSRNPAPIYNDSYVPERLNGPDESTEAVVATGAPAVARNSIQKPQLAFHSNTGMSGFPKPREDELGSKQALPTTELSAHELRSRFGKPRWWFNDGKGKFVYKMQDQPPPRLPRTKDFAASIRKLQS